MHNFDIWMPIIAIAKVVVFPTLVNIITAYILDRIKGREHDNPDVDLTIIVTNRKIKIHYKGDAKECAKILKEVDLKKYE